MKIALLSGAVFNAGDYLITHRSLQLLKSVYPSAQITLFIRNYPLTEQQAQELNACDVAVFCGGPYYMEGWYPDALPPNLDDLKPKIFMLGGGWHGMTRDDPELWSFRFKPKAFGLFSRAVHDTGLLGCRDYLTIKALRASGIRELVMTGCPAWYDQERITTRLEPGQAVRKIMLSDPRNIALCAGQALEVAKFMRGKFPDAEIHYVFHRGIRMNKYSTPEEAKLREDLNAKLGEMGIPSHDISGGYEGFSIYDDCDLHLGYRVHAHIYNLSRRNISILLEEDARGIGVDEVLGLQSIKAFDKVHIDSAELFLRKVLRKLTRIDTIRYWACNPCCLKDIDTYLDWLKDTRFQVMNFAFARMEAYYETMLSHVRSIADYL